mmetsp:Transcript_28812/g.83187  ORF Transcript_28812/g.83187 Transcript_28812/m.83187 type:complete len:134 (-) Transcript_28812:94-495(-)
MHVVVADYVSQCRWVQDTSCAAAQDKLPIEQRLMGWAVVVSPEAEKMLPTTKTGGESSSASAAAGKLRVAAASGSRRKASISISGTQKHVVCAAGRQHRKSQSVGAVHGGASRVNRIYRGQKIEHGVSQSVSQ